MSVNSFATGGLTAVMPWLQKLSTTQPKPLTTKRYHWNLEKRQTLDMTQEDVERMWTYFPIPISAKCCATNSDFKR